MNLTELFIYCEGKVKDHPKLREAIADLYDLARSEIEDGESVTHECELAVGSVDELIKNEEEGE
ncbi:hypothetical protein ACFLQL_00575 [Verrucomicrobiota bacterium]